MTLNHYGEEILTFNENLNLNEIATVKYICSYMTKGEREWVKH